LSTGYIRQVLREENVWVPVMLQHSLASGRCQSLMFPGNETSLPLLPSLCPYLLAPIGRENFFLDLKVCER